MNRELGSGAVCLGALMVLRMLSDAAFRTPAPAVSSTSAPVITPAPSSAMQIDSDEIDWTASYRPSPSVVDLAIHANRILRLEHETVAVTDRLDKGLSMIGGLKTLFDKAEANDAVEATAVNRRLNNVDQRLDDVGNRLDNVGKQLNNVGKQLNNVDTHLDNVGKQLNNVDTHLDNVVEQVNDFDKQLNGVGKHLDDVDGRLDNVSKRLNTIDKRFDTVDQRLNHVHTRFDTLEASLAQILSAVRK